MGKIKELMDMDIIEPVSAPTPWVSPVVIVPKSNSEIRLCLDTRQANRAILRELPGSGELQQQVHSAVCNTVRTITTHFEFWPEQRQSFNALKEELAIASTLVYFDKDAPTKVFANASPVGLGAVLVQIQKGETVPICYVSRCLTDCERRHSQTEKGALALMWLCETLHAYIYGREFELVTDHKPLEAIYSPRSKSCARMERWVL